MMDGHIIFIKKEITEKQMTGRHRVLLPEDSPRNKSKHLSGCAGQGDNFMHSSFILCSWGVFRKRYRGKRIEDLKERLKKNANKGSAALEASLAVPLFLLAMVYLYLAFQSVLAETLVYEAAAETVEYMAELSYLDTCNVAVAYMKFPGYVDEKDTVARYIKGGTGGVSFLGSTMTDEENCIELHVSYQTKYAGTRSYRIRKRAYVGDKKEDDTDGSADSEDPYVYVTDNQSVYHLTRRCTYLTLSIQVEGLPAAQEQGYVACHFCGRDQIGERVFVTGEGDCYHSRISCSGLKRSIYRKKKSEVPELAPCSRCSSY